ncbi:MAG: hypothetical protein WC198_07865 [Victivallaceae bacterium]
MNRDGREEREERRVCCPAGKKRKRWNREKHEGHEEGRRVEPRNCGTAETRGRGDAGKGWRKQQKTLSVPLADT